MKKPDICAVIVHNEPEKIKAVEPSVDLFEVRIDLIGEGWQQVAGQLKKPWIASNRTVDEGGQWQGNEARRIEQLLLAAEMGASIVDIELATKNLGNVIKAVKRRTKCLLSHHDLKGTPPLDTMKEIVRLQLKAGADICKVVTTALEVEDNAAVLQLITGFPEEKIVAFAMGPMGILSRVLCPLVGGEFTYASIEEGKESAPGQITVSDLTKIYGMLKV
ncbi:MAG: type I 3-dehydroquinate dehydratase [Chloroflexi bacterium]|nr:type I 3-dehydroquinate dehydratase [Chloroflexota bacterium]